jgi:hypothetical protein
VAIVSARTWNNSGGFMLHAGPVMFVLNIMYKLG